MKAAGFAAERRSGGVRRAGGILAVIGALVTLLVGAPAGSAKTSVSDNQPGGPVRALNGNHPASAAIGLRGHAITGSPAPGCRTEARRHARRFPCPAPLPPLAPILESFAAGGSSGAGAPGQSGDAPNPPSATKPPSGPGDGPRPEGPQEEEVAPTEPVSEGGKGTSGSDGGGGSEIPPPPPPTGSWFAPTSFWNRALPADAPLASNSSAYVSELVRQVAGSGSWINSDKFSTPVYTVGGGQADVRVHLISTRGSFIDPDLQQAFEAVPIPADAEPAAGTDRHLVVWQPSTDRMWEFWELHREGSEWVAEWGGAMEHVSSNPGYFEANSWAGAKSYWGATATSLPLLGGLMTTKQLQQGEIGHALAIAIPEPSPSYVWPAQRSDGYNDGADAIPEGTIFRLPASLDVSKLELTPTGRAIALAAQRYGLVVRDVSGTVTFYAEAPQAGRSNPYGQIFGSLYPNEVLAGFPWGQLRAIAPSP